MKQPHRILCPVALLGLSITGCASSDDRYPSLAVRDAERAMGTLSTANPGTNILAETPDFAPVQAALDRAKRANDAFVAEQAGVRDLVLATRGLSIENDRRSRALVGLARLTSLRSQTALALADLDQIEVRAATAFADVKDIRRAQSSVLRLVTAQDTVLDSLDEGLTR